MNQSQRTSHNAKAVLNKLQNTVTTTNTGNKRICLSESEFKAMIEHLNAIIEIVEKK